MLDPAKNVIEICGGVAETARLANRSLTSVYRWGYPKEKDGTGGLVPSDCQIVLLNAAHAEGIPLKIRDLFKGRLNFDPTRDPGAEGD